MVYVKYLTQDIYRKRHTNYSDNPFISLQPAHFSILSIYTMKS